MLVISSKEFKDNQAMYFDLVDKGECLIVQKGKKKGYFIRPLTEDDRMSINAELMAKIQKGEQEIKEGKGTTVRNEEELNRFLDSL